MTTSCRHPASLTPPSLPLSHSKILQNKFQLLAKVGEGTYGVVYRARRRDSQELVAIKEIKANDHREEGVQTSSLREISLLMDLKHPNVVKLHEVLNDRQAHKVFMVLDYLDVDLHQFICKAPQLMPGNPHLVKFYLWQLCQALAYCHSRRDIKPQNLLIDFPTNNIKLADFGLARTLGLPVRCLSPEVVTIWYRPPEILLSAQRYTAAVDMWSLGCVFFEMATSKPLFAGTNEIDQMYRIFAAVGYPNEDNWPGCEELPGFNGIAALSEQNLRPHGLEPLVGSSFAAEGLDLLHGLLHLSPQRRITAKEALRHPYFRDIQNILNNPPRLLFS